MFHLRFSAGASARRRRRAALWAAALLVGDGLLAGASTAPAVVPEPGDELRLFDCPELERLQVRVLAENRGLRAAWERLEQARLVARQSGATLWPGAGVTAAATRTAQRETGTSGGWNPLNAAQAGLGVTWELDLRGHAAAMRRAAGRESAASEEDYRATRILLQVEAAEGWLEWRTAQAELALVGEQQRVNEQILTLVESRLAHGEGTALDVHRQRSLAQRTAAEAASVELRRARALRCLEVLAGGAAEVGGLGAAAAELPAVPDIAEVPDAEALARRRPDLRAAFQRIRAADENVAVAVAERLPRITLSLDGILSSERLRSPNRLTTLAGGLGLDLPVFDAGRRRLEVERRRALARELGWTYAELLLTAFAEVQNLAADEGGLRLRCGALAESRRAAAAAVREAQARHLSGQDSFLVVLDALRTEQELAREQLAAELEWRLAWIRFCKARGFGLEAKQ